MKIKSKERPEEPPKSKKERDAPPLNNKKGKPSLAEGLPFYLLVFILSFHRVFLIAYPV